MSPCFEKWCQRFDEAFTHKAQKRGFRQEADLLPFKLDNARNDGKYFCPSSYWWNQPNAIFPSLDS